jgi:hypothetical protein
VPTIVEMIGAVKADVLDTLELDANRRAIVEKALDETWTEERLYAHAAASLEKRLSPQVLDAAQAQMTPEVQAAIKTGISEPATPEQAKKWLEAARKRPDAKVREALARRIAAHMPEPKPFKELLGQVGEVLADIMQVATGTDENRAELNEGLMEGIEPAIQAMGDREMMTMAAVGAFRDESTTTLKALADALDSDAGLQLQRAAIVSLLDGMKQTRQDLVARLQRDLKPAKKE